MFSYINFAINYYHIDTKHVYYDPGDKYMYPSFKYNTPPPTGKYAVIIIAEEPDPTASYRYTFESYNLPQTLRRLEESWYVANMPNVIQELQQELVCKSK